MASKPPPYEQFGPFLLFRKLESGTLGDLWRASRIDKAAMAIGHPVALWRITGGDRTAFLQAVDEAAGVAPQLTGSTFVKQQNIEAIDGVPALTFEYLPGRSLRSIVATAKSAESNPLPLDLAILIAERLAVSLATTAEARQGSERLTHGALIPEFVWITEDGDVRTAGQRLGRGLIASLSNPRIAMEAGRYVAPEYRASGTPSKTSEVYALGAVLFFLLTGTDPPDPGADTSFAFQVRSSKMMTGDPIPLDVRAILDKSLALDPAIRYPSPADMKKALDTAAAKYGPTTFNLAYYVSTILKSELEAEALEREKEAAVDVTPYTVAQVSAPIFTPAVELPQKRSSARTFGIAGAVVLVAAGVAGYLLLARSGDKPAPAQTPAPAAVVASNPPPPEPAVVSPPIVATPVTTTTNEVTQTSATTDPDAAKKAFEEAVNQKVQEEMLKLQANFTRELQQKNARNAPVNTERAPQRQQAVPTPQPVEEAAPSAAALDERRLQARPEPPAQQPQPQPSQPPPTVPAPVPQTEPAPAPAAAVREGDVVDISALDTPPRPLRSPTVVYPPPAVKMRIETSVIITALVSEDGAVLDARVLRGDPRFGFNDSALRAVRTMRFSPPVKDGKRVKTWFPQTINFKL
jgi:TonB family protein